MTSGGGGGGTPYIGSKISLISKAEIRYEGILYDVNTKDSTVTLSKVRSHGTEGRPAVKPVQPRSEVYEYIIFRGSDIKDLSVNEVAKSSEEPQDPAILSTHSSPPVSSQTQAPPNAPPTTVPASVPPPTTVSNPPGLPLQAPPTHHSIPPIYNNPFSLGAMGAGSYNPFSVPYLGRPPFLLNQPGGGVMGGSKPVPVPQRISSSTPANQATPPNSEGVSIIAATTQSKAGPVAEGTPPNTSSASSINTSTPNTGSTISPLQNSISASDSSWSRPSVSEGVALPPDPVITDSSHDNEDTEEPSEQTPPHTGGAGGGGGGGGRKARQFKERGGGSAGRGGPHRQPRPHSGGPKTSSESAPPNGIVAKKPLRYDSDFDFDIANALFSKETIEKEIKEKLKITTGDRQQVTGDEAAAPLRWEGPGEEVGGASEGLLQEEEDPVQSYDREVSFFDNISCEANTSNKKYNRSEERALNTETFGITSRGPPRGGRARGGRGQRGRGYSRGGRSDRMYRHDDGYGQQRDGHYRNRGGSYRGRGRNDYHGDSYGRNDYHGDGYRGRDDPHGDGYRGRGDPHGDSYRGRGDPRGDGYRGRGDPHGDSYRGRGDPHGDCYRGRGNYHGDGYRGRGGYHGNDNRGRKDHYGNAYHRSDYPRSREY